MRPEDGEPFDLVVEDNLHLRLEGVDERVDRLGALGGAVVYDRPAGLGCCHAGMLLVHMDANPVCRRGACVLLG
jgi:hypothetical protein